MNRYCPSVRQPGCPDEFDENDCSWSAAEAESFIRQRGDEMEVVFPYIDLDLISCSGTI